MAANSGQLVQALISGGVAPSAARIIANALANANTPQFSSSRDSSDQTPVEQLRLITPDTRKYQLNNLDYSREQPYQQAIESYPGRYTPGTTDHPYKDSQPVLPAPPLSTPRIIGGPYTEVTDSIVDGAQQTTIGLKIARKSGTHLRVNEATNSLDVVALEISAPQGLVTATVSEDSGATTIQLQVRGIQSRTILLGDGTTASTWVWDDSSQTPAQQMVTPAGAVMPFAGLLPVSMATAWLLCDGTSYQTATYPNLFAIVGYTYGGSGANFNVPDLRGYFIRGFGLNADATGSGRLGVKQGDTLAGHTHTIGLTHYNAGSAAVSSGNLSPNNNGVPNGGFTANGWVTNSTGGSTLSQIVNAANGSQSLRVKDATNIHLGMAVSGTGIPAGSYITAIASTATASTTGTASNGSTSLTVASVSGILVGMLVTGTGIRADTHVVSISGSVVTLSLTTNLAITNSAVSFSSTDVTISAPVTQAITNGARDFATSETRPKNVAMHYYIKT